MTAEERYKVALNVWAKTGAEGDFSGEFARTMSMANNMDTYTALNPPQPPIPPVTGQNSPEVIPNTQEGQLPPIT